MACARSEGTANPNDDDLASTAEALIKAPLDTAHPFSVGICQGVLNTDPAKGKLGTCQAGTLRGTGTLVAPNLVLTARHAVHATKGEMTSTHICEAVLLSEPFVAGGTRMTTSPSVMVGAPHWYDVAEVLVSPDTDNMCDGDVALLILPENITDVEPAWVDLQRDVRWEPPGDGKLAYVGRGVIDKAVKPGTYETARIDLGNLMRRYLRGVPFLCAGIGCTLPDFSSPPNTEFKVASAQFAVGRAGLNGDSGTGILLDASFDTKPTVVGVHTLGMWGADGESTGGIGARLEPHKHWLARGAQKAAKRGGYPTPGWAMEVLEKLDATDDASSPLRGKERTMNCVECWGTCEGAATCDMRGGWWGCCVQ